jgi:hypothetical protein
MIAPVPPSQPAIAQEFSRRHNTTDTTANRVDSLSSRDTRAGHSFSRYPFSHRPRYHLDSFIGNRERYFPDFGSMVIATSHFFEDGAADADIRKLRPSQAR